MRGLHDSGFQARNAKTLPEKVAEDVTLVWPDDNHGNMRQMPTIAEQRPAGRLTRPADNQATPRRSAG